MPRSPQEEREYQFVLSQRRVEEAAIEREALLEAVQNAETLEELKTALDPILRRAI